MRPMGQTRLNLQAVSKQPKSVSLLHNNLYPQWETTRQSTQLLTLNLAHQPQPCTTGVMVINPSAPVYQLITQTTGRARNARIIECHPITAIAVGLAQSLAGPMLSLSLLAPARVARHPKLDARNRLQNPVVLTVYYIGLVVGSQALYSGPFFVLVEVCSST